MCKRQAVTRLGESGNLLIVRDVDGLALRTRQFSIFSRRAEASCREVLENTAQRNKQSLQKDAREKNG